MDEQGRKPTCRLPYPSVAARALPGALRSTGAARGLRRGDRAAPSGRRVISEPCGRRAFTDRRGRRCRRPSRAPSSGTSATKALLAWGADRAARLVRAPYGETSSQANGSDHPRARYVAVTGHRAVIDTVPPPCGTAMPSVTRRFGIGRVDHGRPRKARQAAVGDGDAAGGGDDQGEGDRYTTAPEVSRTETRLPGRTETRLPGRAETRLPGRAPALRLAARARQRLAAGFSDLPLAAIVRFHQPMGVRIDEHHARIEPRQAQPLRELLARQRPAFDQCAEHVLQRNQRVMIVVFRHPLPTRGYGRRAGLGKS